MWAHVDRMGSCPESWCGSDDRATDGNPHGCWWGAHCVAGLEDGCHDSRLLPRGALNLRVVGDVESRAVVGCSPLLVWQWAALGVLGVGGG